MGIVPLKELAEHTFAIAKGIVEEGQEACPCFMVQTPDTIIPILIAGGWKNDRERDQTYKFIHDQLLKLHAVSYAHVSEAWTLERADAETWDGEVRPREHPRRVEALSCMAFDNNGVHYAMLAKIERRDGKRFVGTPEVAEQGTVFGGAGADLFTPRN